MQRNDTAIRTWEDAIVIIPGSQYGTYPQSALQVFGFVLLALFPILSLVVCGLRAYSRRLVGGFGLDDWFAFVAMVLAIPQAMFTAFYIKSGYWAVHDADVPPRLPPNLGVFWNFMLGLCSTPTVCIVKASALLFLLRFGGVKRKVRIACRVLITVNLIHMIIFFFCFLFQCVPVESRWLAGPKAKCLRTDLLSISMACISIITDILTLSVPFVIFLDLRANKRMRNALISVFLLGGLVTFASCARLQFLIRLYYLSPDDRHYSLGFICNAIELNLAIITASVPALWPLARKWFPSAFASLGIGHPQDPDIEIGYATNPSRASASSASRTSRALRSTIIWRDRRTDPKEFRSDSEISHREDGPSELPDLPDRHIYDRNHARAEEFELSYHELVRKAPASEEDVGSRSR